MELKRQNGGWGLGGGTGARSGQEQLAWAPRLAGPHSSPQRQGAWLGGFDGVGGGPQPGCSTPQASPLSAGSAVFSLSRADPFSALSVISNNVTASLVSTHQSRKKPILTLIKKKIPSVPPGDTESSVWTAGALPPTLPFHLTRVIRFHRVGSPPTRGSAVLPRAALLRTH